MKVSMPMNMNMNGLGAAVNPGGWVFSLADPDPDRDSWRRCGSWYAHEPPSSAMTLSDGFFAIKKYTNTQIHIYQKQMVGADLEAGMHTNKSSNSTGGMLLYFLTIEIHSYMHWYTNSLVPIKCQILHVACHFWKVGWFQNRSTQVRGLKYCLISESRPGHQAGHLRTAAAPLPVFFIYLY